MHDFELTNITGTSTNLVHEVLSGTCGSLTSVSCSDPNTSSVTGLTIGDTYYVRVYTFFSGDEASNFDLCVTDPCIGGAPANDNPCTATSLAVGASCAFSSYTNACTNDSGEPNPGCASYAGADAWFTAVVPASGHLIVDCNTGGVTDGGMAFYTGTCSSLTFLECDDDDSPNGLMPMLDRCNLTPGSVVYIRFWEYGADNNGTFSICAYDGAAPGACSTGQVIASLPFAQTGLTTAGAGDDFSSFDICSSSYMNGDDYVFEYTCTADEDITITLTNTGTSVGVFVTEGCPDNICSICVTENSALGCGNGSGTNTNSAGNPFGTFSLNAGNTYYITVSTNPAPQATAFDIDITTAPPGVGGVVPQQDCVVSEPVCGSTISAPNPGFSGTGNNCDFDGSGNCLLTGEKESAWYLIDISGNGTLYFNLVATDATTSSCGTETDYDFAIWKVAGTGATDCATIQSTGGAGVLACNYNPDGVTGCAPGGNAPSPYSACFDAAFEPGVAVLAGEQFLLVVQNWTVNTSGFDLDFSPTAAGVINYSAPTTVLWKGSNGTDWTDPANWGSCGIPSCTVDANIAYSSTGQPVLTVNATAKDVTINSGATLTINAGVTLTVCGNFTNNGTLIAASGSIIEFTGTGTQNITGTLTGVNKMSNMTVNKSSGSVILNDNVEIEQVTTLSSGEVNLNGNSLIILNGATTALTRTSGYIISQSESGVIQWNTNTGGAYAFPFVYNSKYIPFTFDKKGDATASNVSVSTWSTGTANATNLSPGVSTPTPNPSAGNTYYVDRWWNITPVPAITADLTFEWTNAEQAGVNFTDGTVSYHWNSGLVDWEEISEIATTCTGTDGNCVKSIWTSYSLGGAGGKGGVLPIELLSFNAEYLPAGKHGAEGKVELTWITTSEINNDFFTVEASSNPSQGEERWAVVGTVKGAGYSNTILHYSLTDYSPPFGEDQEGQLAYYRLKQTDFDGLFEYSDIVVVQLQNKNTAVLEVYPNPSNGSLEVRLTGYQSQFEEFELRIFDVIGQRVFQTPINQSDNGQLSVSINLQLPKGVYFLQVATPDEMLYKKIIIQ